jgi:RHS repeat-associated protein
MKYLHGPGIDEPIKGFGRDFNETYYADGLGSIVKVERDNGEFFNLVYDSFGRMTVFDKDHQKVTLGKDSLLTYGYTGREIDAESGVNYYRARYYSPEIGRFISEDPIQFDSLEINLFRYGFNNPILNTDPSGKLSPISVGVCLVAFALGIAVDAYLTIKDQIDHQELLDKESETEAKSCSNDTKKLTKFDNDIDRMRDVSSRGLKNAAGVYFPGVGTISAAVVCVASLILF